MAVTNQWCGAVDESSGWVRSKIEGSSGELFVSTSSDMSGEMSAGTDSATSDGMISVRATSLNADTTYYFEVEDADGVRGPTGRFHVHGTQGQPYRYRFAAFGDAGLNPDFPGDGDELDPNRVSNHPTFDTIRTGFSDLLFVAHLGDMHYYNLGGTNNDGTVANYRTSYDDVLDQPRQHELYYRLPIVWTWDDHDYGPNNSDGTYVDKANAAQVFRERVPHYTLAESTGPIYHSFQIGRVLHVCADVRYDRSPNDDPDDATKTMLGSSQKTWMDNLLANTSAELLIWHMPSQWMGTSNDSWNSFQTERDELVTMFGDRGFLDRMMIISADYHGLAIDTGANSAGGIPVFQFASIDSAFGDDPTQYDLGASAGRSRFGTVEVDDRGKTIRVIGDGWIDTDLWQTHTWFNVDPVTRVPLLGLDYTAGHVSPPFEPTEDDQQLRNDVTAKREGGSSARQTKTSGPLSTQAPPDGVGIYDESVTVNVAGDDQLPDQAGWRVHLGTVDEPRYPEVTVNLARNQDLQSAVSAVESGDRFTIAGVPGWLPPGTVELLAQGYEERLTAFEWTWTANTSPARPWTVGVLGDEELGRLDTSGSELSASISESATSFDVDTLDGNATWIDGTDFSGDFPLDIEVGGEVMRVTDVSGSSSPQTFTVERSINGVTKSHDAGAAVALAQPLILAL